MTADGSARPLAGRRVALTGGTGFVGPHLARALHEAGARLTVLVRPSSDRARLAGVDPAFVEGGVDDEAALARLVAGATDVVHAAGLNFGPSAAAYERVNAEGTARMVRAASAAGVRSFAYVSSQAATGPTAVGAPARRESDPPAPQSAYGHSKLRAEEAVAREGGAIASRVLLRAGAVYGPGDREFLAYFKLTKLGLRPVLGDGTRVFNPVHAADVAAAAVRALVVSPPGLNACYVVAPPVTWNAFGLAVAAAMGRTPWRIAIPDRIVPRRLLGWFPPTRATADRLADFLQARWEADPSGARALLDFAPAVTLADGLASTYRWYREHRWL